MKTLQSLFAGSLLLFSFNARASNTNTNSNLNLYNPDVRKCLVEASKAEGWELKSVYLDENNKVVMVFDKDNDTKIYKSK